MDAEPYVGSGSQPGVNRPSDMVGVDFAVAPFIVIWELTRACDLACVHCRAEAVSARHPLELTTAEGFRLLDQMREFGRPLVVFTGGDPLKRPDVLDLIRHGSEIGLRMTMTPSGTPLMTPDTIDQLKDSGLVRLAVSLDGATAEAHDRFRRVAGSFAWSVQMLHYARKIGLSTQVNTTISRHNVADFDAMGGLMVDLGIDLWSVFFLVATGRGQQGQIISPEEHEEIFGKMYDLASQGHFDVKSTAAPQYRRYMLQRQAAERREKGRSADHPRRIGFAPRRSVSGAPRSVNDGNGFVFVSHVGEVYPSGFLPLRAGNVRQQSLVDIYRTSNLLRQLRDYGAIQGKCGVCEFRDLCGGSRARAYSCTGDVLESDPACAYVPGPLRRGAMS